MGTRNFNDYQASKIYSITDIEDEFIAEDTTSNIKYELLEEFKDEAYEVDNSIGDRNYPANNFIDIDIEDNYLNIGSTLSFKVLVSSGYYEGVNYDYKIEINSELHSVTFDTVEEYLEDLYEYSEDYELNKGLLAIHDKSYTNHLNNILDKVGTKIEETLSNHTDILATVGTFSNGEATYQVA